MRVAIATEGDFVAQHFGRCPGFTIFDIKDSKILSKNFVENPGYKTHQHGQIPKFLKQQNINCVIAGGIGPNALMNLQSFRIEVIVGVTGKVEEVIDKFINVTLTGGESLCHHVEHKACKH